jgi:hypothetical protein
MQRNQPRGAGADHKRQRADAEQQQRGVEHRPRQHIGDQIAPQIGRGVHRQRDDRDHGRSDHDRGHDSDGRRDPSGVRGWVHVKNFSGERYR